MKMQEIETDRLILREIVASDASQIVEWRADPKVYKFFTIPKKLSVAEHLAWYHNKYLRNENRVELIAFNKDQHKPVGIFGISKLRAGAIFEISYLVDPCFRSQGYAGEAVSALIHIGKTQWDCNICTAKIHKANIASLRFAERLGFKEAKQELDFIIMEKNL